MVRSAAALAAVLIIPSLALAQEPQGTHTVVKDDTLWDLAQRYYSNPFEWRVIWNANRDVVDDPNWIYPAELLVIPGLPGQTSPAERPSTGPASEPVEEIEGVPIDLVPFGLRQARPVAEGGRTVFFNDTSGVRRSQVLETRDSETLVVSQDRAYSAPRLIGPEADPEHSGSIAGFAERGKRASTIRSFDRVRLEMSSPARVGAYLQLFRVEGTIEDVGQVVIPTGVAQVETIGDGEVVAVVVKEYDRIQAGDFVGPLPAFDLRPGQQPSQVSGGSEAMIMGFAGRQVLTDIGHVVFLDLGSEDGVRVGDEFVLYGEAMPTSSEGHVQVIGVQGTVSSARVMSMRGDVFRQGVVLRLVRTMN